MFKTTHLKNTLLSLAFVATATLCNAQVKENDWSLSTNQKVNNSKQLVSSDLPSEFSIWELSATNFKNKLYKSDEFQELKIPSPKGTFETYMIKSSNIVADEVAHLYTIKTFSGYKKDDPTTLIACDISDSGFHAAVYTEDHSYFIEPLYINSPNKVIVFFKKNSATRKFNCMSNSESTTLNKQLENNAQTPTTKRTYRLAILAANNYKQQFGGNPYNNTNVLNAMASGVNLVNPIYLRDFGVSFSLISNSSLIRNNNNSSNITGKINNVIGSGAYDIGHMVLWGGEDGLAGINVVCGNDKGDGYSSSSLGVSTLWVDYVAHEMGHQFGSEHNHSGCNGVNNFRYEPGEGSSIMSYANVCQGNEQYTQNSDPFFHYASIAQVQSNLSSFNCATTNSSGNTSAPVANAKANFTIPKSTPFIVVGSGSDNNDPNNNLSYQWVQYDGNGGSVNNSPNCNSNNAALFRFRSATTDNYRSLPQYNAVLAGNNDQEWEKLPCTSRNMKFSLTVRDNNSSFGRVNEDRTTITVANTGPFNVTSPNGGESLSGNDQYTVTWTVNNTDSHCSNVDILISTDSGNTYSVVANATTNDGSETITLPNVSTSNARVLVRCDVNGGFRAASTFYDVSNADFSIQYVLSTDEFSHLGISIFPNPASDNITIKTKDNTSYIYNIFSVNGKSIYKAKINKTTRLNTSKLANGLYFLEISDLNNHKTVVKKIVINH